MDEANDALTPSAIIGQRLRQLRAERHWRQEDVAHWMLWRGGNPHWTQATVAAVELGRRDVADHELFSLTLIFGLKAWEWFEGDGWVQLGANAASRRFYRAYLGSGETADDPEREVYLATQEVVRENADEIINAFGSGVVQRLWPDAPRSDVDMRQVVHDSELPAEQKAARKFKLEPLTVSMLAHGAWGHGLTAERDARVEARTDETTTDRSRQALRGHVTRQLLAELEDVVFRFDVHTREKQERQKGGR